MVAVAAVWGVSEIQAVSPDVEWNPDTFELLFNTEGVYRIDANHRIQPAAGSSNLFTVIYISGLSSPEAPVDTPLNNGSHHYQPIIASASHQLYEYWYGDTFFYEASAGDVLTLLMTGEGPNGTGLTANVALDVSVQRLGPLSS